MHPGDLLLAATDVDDRQVDLRRHAGAGRILHYDRDGQLRGELRTQQTGLVVGLAIDPRDGRLYACDPGSQTVSVFARDGTLQGLMSAVPRGRIGSLLFDAPGRFVAGVHSRLGEDPARPAPRLLTGTIEPPLHEGLTVDIDGGRQGFHCVTHMALAADGRTLYYVSEGGRRLMRYDLAERRQLPDFLQLATDDPRGTYGPAAMADGRVWLATGQGAVQLSGDGRTLLSVAPETDRGWSRITLSRDGQVIHLGNFLTGILEHRDAESGRLLGRIEIGRRYSLSGVVEVP